MVKLRDYQQDLLERIERSLSTDPRARIMVQLPTGGGKTYIAGELLIRLLHGRKAVWLTHRHELAEQTKQMLSKSGVSAATNIGWGPDNTAPSMMNGVVILMAQKVSQQVKRNDVWREYGPTDIMIVDEAHHAAADGYKKAMELWRGPIIGLTATPWRLSLREGFDHLFGELLRGPQIVELQRGGYLCPVQTLVPDEKERILGGLVGLTGDYSEGGIESANEGSNIWTAGAIDYWKEHGKDRQTIVYAVSVTHADNLLRLFQDSGVAARKLLGNTPLDERRETIQRFQSGQVKVIVNVAVATEGFDLPDARCILITRPTKSLSLYLQMVGRGMRPKSGDGDCLVLDMPGNSLSHGLPEQNREWSLPPRSDDIGMGLPSQWCPHCDHMSPPASHYCENCHNPFGETCPRCGKWRVWTEWFLLERCQREHQRVCDGCHHDAHVMANLPVTEDMKELREPVPDPELDPDRNPFLKDLLEEELRKVTDRDLEHTRKLEHSIKNRDGLLADDSALQDLFELPIGDPETARRFADWESNLKIELAAWTAELAALQSRRVDKQRVFTNALERVTKLLEAEARAMGLLPDEPDQPVGVTIRPPLPLPPSMRAPRDSLTNKNLDNKKPYKGYRHPATGETWELKEAFYSVATEEERRIDEDIRKLPNKKAANSKSYAHRRKVVTKAGFIPN